GIDDGMNLNI
nr:Chain P, decamer fragment of Serine acetyltransferase [synthetic construct]